MAKKGLYGSRRRERDRSRPGMVEVLEPRALLADGITAAPAPPLTAAEGVPITDAVFATFTVTDPSAAPGPDWRALINFGDGQAPDGPLIPTQKGEEFEFVDTHTYRVPGTYTVTVMIAVPGSHLPNDNTVTTQVTVTTSAGSPTSTPAPTPTPAPPPPLEATGLRAKARDERVFHGSVAHIRAAGRPARDFSALIDWGDQSAPTPARIRALGPAPFAVIGSHRYGAPGIYPLTISIRDAAGRQVIAHSSMRVIP